PNSKFATSIITNFDRPDKDMTLVIELPIEPGSDAVKFEQIALDAAKEVRSSMADVTAGEPSFRYSALASAGATAQLSIKVTDFTKAGEVKHLILRHIYEELHKAQPAKPPEINPQPPNETL